MSGKFTACPKLTNEMGTMGSVGLSGDVWTMRAMAACPLGPGTARTRTAKN